MSTNETPPRDRTTIATIAIDPATGSFALSQNGGDTIIVRGTWREAQSSARVLDVPLSYDPSAYMDALHDRRQAEERADRLRAALEAIAELGPGNSRDLARAALDAPFEVNAMREASERAAAEGRRRAAWDAAEAERRREEER